ncbi:MAG TPA: magnesium transporter CorA family protein [Pelolinea sp.]|nr:magnesium transporter CorA family protein [Pelolinea sp.]
MITILKTAENKLSKIPQVADGAWINVVNPSALEIEETYGMGIPLDFITYSLDQDERPRTEKESGATLLLHRIPYYQGDTEDIPYRTVPLGIILCFDYIITVCKFEVPFLKQQIAKLGQYFSANKRNRCILQILLAVANQYLAAVRVINKKVDQIEDELHKSIQNKEVLELLKFQKSLELFSTALKSNELVFEKLQRSRFFATFPEDTDLLEDVITENQQALEMTMITGNLLSQMMDAFASIISNNQNQVIKVLTSVTIILSLPTLISSFYGMNLALPLQGANLGYLVIASLSVAVMGLAGLFFRKMNWL